MIPFIDFNKSPLYQTGQWIIWVIFLIIGAVILFMIGITGARDIRWHLPMTLYIAVVLKYLTTSDQNIYPDVYGPNVIEYNDTWSDIIHFLLGPISLAAFIVLFIYQLNLFRFAKNIPMTIIIIIWMLVYSGGFVLMLIKQFS